MVRTKSGAGGLMQHEKIKVFFSGDDYDREIKAELKRRGLKPGQVAIIALPESMRPKKKERQRKIFKQ
jgi:hypothetical protein